MIDRANANAPRPASIPSTPTLQASVHPWSTPAQPVERPVARPVAREASPRVTSAAARVHEGMQALPWPSRDQAADHAARQASSPVLRECLVGLRDAVEGYVGRRRDEGTPVERVLAEVKTLVRRAEGCDLSREATDALMPQVVLWGIHAFYDGDTPRADARRDP